jgi:hypothetical protein
LKKAKAGETQRVIKKVKFLRKKQGGGDGDAAAEAELKDLEMQLEALKVCSFPCLSPSLLCGFVWSCDAMCRDVT